jgi:hypothetical protein
MPAMYTNVGSLEQSVTTLKSQVAALSVSGLANSVTLTASGAVPLDKRVVFIVPGSSTLNLSLANGTYVGQEVTFVETVNGSGNAILTPVTYANGATLRFSAAFHTASLLYTGPTLGWVNVGTPTALTF